ncbi:MAG TPA: LUD domain-containing protein [Candidatus Omnitrophota bacterium]|nr:LUD domain-containing protein [Candidatus Omnitrophota bacterium]
MTARDAILGNIRRALHRDVLPACEQANLNRRMADSRPNVVPARGRGDHGELVERFRAMAVETQATLARVADEAAVPAAIAAFLADAGIAPAVVASPALSGLDWGGAGLQARLGAALPGDLVSVTPTFRAVAETGSLVTLSAPDRPSSLHFLPDVHIALVKASEVVGAYEDAWAALRQAGALPRTVNLITGPSRTADIEQSLLLGAHGPRRLHVILIDHA